MFSFQSDGVAYEGDRSNDLVKLFTYASSLPRFFMDVKRQSTSESLVKSQSCCAFCGIVSTIRRMPNNTQVKKGSSPGKSEQQAIFHILD